MRRHATAAFVSLLLATSGCSLLEQLGPGNGSEPVPAAQAAVADPLACKLLKASGYAYRVNANGTIAPDTGLAALLGESGEA